MALEIERRFLVCSEGWKALVERREPMEQGYLSQGPEGITVRVRRAADKAWLTLKARTASTEVRHEFEYPIPVADATALLALTPRRIEKTRHHLRLPGGIWVVDVFHGTNAPLIVAEVELDHAGTALERPEWCGEEITSRGDLSNAALAEQPWSRR
ncbi:MAG: CYTH domain-containing protein [Synechococcus sp. MED-G71]|nr:MAG: CYTH domain-containing protein [Synechococcus sp. MED-G71]|tara:strand:- start:1193 stop:1660 length:468 start_codon:yes stop_codon:yes gene_type:complete